jgi:hypothetical protein
MVAKSENRLSDEIMRAEQAGMAAALKIARRA